MGPRCDRCQVGVIVNAKTRFMWSFVCFSIRLLFIFFTRALWLCWHIHSFPYVVPFVLSCFQPIVPSSLRAFVSSAFLAFLPSSLRLFGCSCLYFFVPLCLRFVSIFCLRTLVPSFVWLFVSLFLRSFVPSCVGPFVSDWFRAFFLSFLSPFISSPFRSQNYLFDLTCYPAFFIYLFSHHSAWFLGTG